MSSGTIFDLFEPGEPKLKDYSKVSDDQKGYIDVASNSPMPTDDSFFSKVGEYGKTALKAVAEGATRLGRVMGPLQGRETTEELIKNQNELLNEFLPTKDEDFIQRGLKRGLAFAPTALASPGAGLGGGGRALLGGFAGEAVKEAGGPEWLQTTAEITASLGPDITKKLLTQGKDKELIKRAKEMGFTDEQITPLLQSESKQKWLTKISPKTGKIQEKLKSTKEHLDKTYNVLQEAPIAKKEISEKANGLLVNKIKDRLASLPRELQGKIEGDLNDLLNNKITGSSLMNFWKDLNAQYSGDKKKLSILKGPIMQALESISPQMGKDFELVNNLYTKYFPIASKLKPDVASKLISGVEYVTGVGALTATLFGHFEPLIGIVGEQSMKHFAKELLINPRLQQIAQKTANAINDNKVPMTMKLIKLYAHEIQKKFPEISKELEKISEEDLKNLIEKSQESE